MSKLNAYLKDHVTLTLTLMWICFGISLGYALLALLVFPQWNFWLMAIPGLLALYFRIMYSKGYYALHPERDKYSDQYIPYKQRKKLEEDQKKGQKKT